MKWGQTNGPPYPLAWGDHSAREKRLAAKMAAKDAKWAKKKYTKIYNKTYKKSARDLNNYVKYDLNTKMNLRNPSGSINKGYINMYNRKLAELMNMNVGDLRAPSGKVVQFVAKRGEVGVHMALADEGYNIDQLKNGVFGSGKVAYKKNTLDKV